MIQSRRFHFRPALTVCAGVAFAFLIALGNWQLKRLEWKESLISKIEARVAAEPIAVDIARSRAAAGEDMEFAPVRLFGSFDLSKDAPVFGVAEGKAGSFQFIPVRLANDQYVYVNTGFFEEGVAYDGWLGYRGEPVEIIGYFRAPEKLRPPKSWVTPQTQSSDGYWFVRDPQLFAAVHGIAAAPFYIEQNSASSAGPNVNIRNKHFEYALTWFGLAGALFAVWLAMSLRRAE